MERNNDDFIKVSDFVNEPHNNRRRQMYNQNIIDEMRMNCSQNNRRNNGSSSRVRYSKKQKTAKGKVALIMAGAAFFAVSGMYICDAIQLEKIKADMPSYVIEETYLVNNNQNFAYQYPNIAVKLMNEDTIYDKDTLIYKIYDDFRGHNSSEAVVNDNMDKIFKFMHTCINSGDVTFSNEIYKSCNYATFSEYLEAKGMENSDDYISKMNDVLRTYKDKDDIQHTLEANGLILDYDYRLSADQSFEQILDDYGITLDNDSEGRSR